MPDTIDAARKLIADRLAAIEAEVGRLRQALTSMGETDGAAPASSKPPGKRGTGKRRRFRAPRGRRREQLLAAIAARPGARQAALAAEVGISPSQVSVLIAGLRKEKLVVKKGAGYALTQ